MCTYGWQTSVWFVLLHCLLSKKDGDETMIARQPQFELAKAKAKEVINDNFILAPPVRIDQLVLNYELSVKEATFDPPYDNVSGFIDLDTKTIVVNKADSINRQAFTLAHELGHWLLHKQLLQEDPNRSIVFRIPLGKADKDPIEKEANCFAAELLVPNEFLDQYKNEDIGMIARIFGVSSEVIGYRIGHRRDNSSNACG
jgi:Zn-dependent peptidase ImmA (M78 family)